MLYSGIVGAQHPVGMGLDCLHFRERREILALWERIEVRVQILLTARFAWGGSRTERWFLDGICGKSFAS